MRIQRLFGLPIVVALAMATALAAERPNVAVLFVDDLGYRDIGIYGGPVQTPTLDTLAANGARFTDFHSGSMTGRHHIRTGVYHVINDRSHDMHLLEREVTTTTNPVSLPSTPRCGISRAGNTVSRSRNCFRPGTGRHKGVPYGSRRALGTGSACDW